jgi:hypothetical protein
LWKLFAAQLSPLTRRRNRPPQRDSLGAGGLGIPKQRLELMGVQPEGRWFRIGRPPAKAPAGKAFLTEPKTLPVLIGRDR